MKAKQVFSWSWIFGAVVVLMLSCSHEPNKRTEAVFKQREFPASQKDEPLPFVCIIDTPFCDSTSCRGSYFGPEFIDPQYIDRLGLNGTDIAHQYSNKMCKYVGMQLKKLYAEGKYSKVDFAHITMSTEGMGTEDNTVKVMMVIPFKRVPKEQATTAFDHCGGWGHRPEIQKRKFDLLHSSTKIVKYNRLQVSRLMKTKEGLEEYWIQWQHTDYQ